MTLNKFWKSKEYLAIHCDTQGKAERLCKAFDDRGNRWFTGKSYKNTLWHIYQENTCYTNDGCIIKKECGSTYLICNVIPFDSIDDFKPKVDKPFTKADLHSWDIVVFRDGKAGIVRLDMDCIIMKNGADKLDDIRNDLIFDTDHNGDIMQVYRPTEPYQCTYDEDKYYLDGKLMFDRKP